MTSKNTPESAPADDQGAPETADVLDALAQPGEVDDTPTVVIDDRIKAFVDNGQKRTEAAPRKWSFVKLPEAEVKRVTREAKKYARATNRVFRVKNTGDPNRLVYRVVAKATEAPAPEASE